MRELTPRRHLPWQLWAAGIYLAVNVALMLVSYPLDGGPDWDLWSALPDSIARGAMYYTSTEASFVWSPVAGWFMALVPTWIGYWLWCVLHIAVVFLLRDLRLIAITLISPACSLIGGAGPALAPDVDALSLMVLQSVAVATPASALVLVAILWISHQGGHAPSGRYALPLFAGACVGLGASLPRRAAKPDGTACTSRLAGHLG